MSETGPNTSVDGGVRCLEEPSRQESWKGTAMRTQTTRMILAAALCLSPVALVHAGGHRGNQIGAPGSKFAQQHPRRNEVNTRVANQRARINQGVKSGKLMAQQAQQLKANDKAMKQQEHADVKANGGHLTKREQKQLNQEENANSTLIHDEKHSVK